MPNGNNNQTPVDDVAPPMPVVNQEPTDAVDPTPATVITDAGSAAPSDDIVMPSVVGTVSPPQKKFAGGKVIATILGLFLLVGGVGAGVFLTGKNQDVRKKAAAEDGYRVEYKCTKSGETPQWCLDSTSNDYNCPNDTGGPRPCSDAYWNGWDCSDGPHSEPCTGIGGGGGENVNPICVGPTEAYDTSWNKLSSVQLSQIKVGDKIRFTVSDKMGVSGSGITGPAKKARFTINGVLRPEVTTKDPSGNKFYDEYTVTAADINLVTFTVKAEVGVLDKWAD